MADKTYTVVRTDMLSGTHEIAYLRSAKFFNAENAQEDIENGRVVKIGALLEGEREIRKAETPAVDTPLSQIGLVASPEYFVDERNRNLSDFTNKIDGDALRVYMLKTGDMFGVTASGFNTTPAVGNIVELQASTTMKVTSTLTSGSTQIGTIIAIENESGYTYYVVEVA